MAGILDKMAFFDAIQRAESSVDPYTTSETKPLSQLRGNKKGAIGPMQVKAPTAADPGYGVPNIFEIARGFGFDVAKEDIDTARMLLQDPEVNRAFGEAYLEGMLNKFGNMDEAAAAYNWGPGEKGMGGGAAGMPQETREYVSKVRQFYNQATGQTMPVNISPRPKMRPKGLLDQ